MPDNEIGTITVDCGGPFEKGSQGLGGADGKAKRVEDASQSNVFDEALSLWRVAGRCLELTVEGTSMGAMVRPGEKARVRLLAPEDLRQGDLIAFRERDALVIHRLLHQRREGDRLQLCEKGDGQSEWRWIDAGRLLGRVERLDHQGRRRRMDENPWRAVNTAAGLFWGLWVSLVGLAGPQGAGSTVNMASRLFARLHGALLKVLLLILFGYRQIRSRSGGYGQGN